MSDSDEPRRLQTGDVATASAVLARAFINDPAMVFLEPNPLRRPAFLDQFCLANVHLALQRGEAWGLGEPVRAVSLWMPGVVSVVQYVRAGFWKLGVRWPHRIHRLVHSGNVVEAMHHKAMSAPHDYLLMLGVDPSAQGQGLGSRLVRSRQRLRARPIYLETMTPKNVALYQHLGFEQVGEDAFEPKTPVYAMRWSV